MIKAFVIAAAFALTNFVAGQLTIASPPSLVQCQPVALSWSGGTAPYILAVIPGGQTSAAALETINDNLSGTSTTWTVNLAAGTGVTLKITDATGTSQYTGQFTIQQGASNSCLNSTATSAAGAAGVTSSVAAASGSSSASGASGTSSASMSSMMASSSAAAAAGSSSAPMSSSAAATSSSASKAASSSASASSAAASASKSGGAIKGSHAEMSALVLAAVGGFAALL